MVKFGDECRQNLNEQREAGETEHVVECDGGDEDFRSCLSTSFCVDLDNESVAHQTDYDCNYEKDDGWVHINTSSRLVSLKH